MHCASPLSLAPEELVNMSRTLTVPEPISVTPTVWVRPRQGPTLADLVRQPGTAHADGDSDSFDVLGTAFAATDGDPRTAWTAPQGVVQHRVAPTLTLTLPEPTEVAALEITPSSSALPTHPTLVAVDLGDGPQVRATEAEGTQTLSLRPRVTKTIKLSLLDWDDIIDRTALGFDQVKPPGLAEVVALRPDGTAIAPADAARNRARAITVGCDAGPVIAVAGRFVHTSVHTTVGALLDGGPIAVTPCEREPLALPAGQQELLISPGAAFIVDGARLTGPLGNELPSAATTPASAGAWGPDHRELRVPPSPVARVIVVPESINPGWTATTDTGITLTPVPVNGWQQGWLVPAGTSGTVTLNFPSNALYRAGLAGGLALLPVLLLLALLPARRRVPDAPVRHVGAGPVGVRRGGGGRRDDLRRRRRRGVRRGRTVCCICSAGDRRVEKAVTLGAVSAGLILAGAVLSRYPWRSVDGYVGHSAGVQFLALVSVAALAASAIRAENQFLDTKPQDDV